MLAVVFCPQCHARLPHVIATSLKGGAIQVQPYDSRSDSFRQDQAQGESDCTCLNCSFVETLACVSWGLLKQTCFHWVLFCALFVVKYMLSWACHFWSVLPQEECRFSGITKRRYGDCSQSQRTMFNFYYHQLCNLLQASRPPTHPRDIRSARSSS